MAFCSLYQSSNIGFQPLKSNPEICMTYDCPIPTTTTMDDYFQQSSWGSNINNSCMKPLADAEVSKQYRCDERWYDWFTVPNYHLGNGYINPDPSNPGTCYNPCLPGSIPTYQTDPVDGQNLHFLTNIENTGNCISRENYFGGKYASGSDYCPLSWIYILNSTHNDLTKMVNTHNQTFANSELAKDVLTDAFTKNQNNSSMYATNIFNSLPIELNNISTPSSTMQNACNRIETPERLLPAYNMCSNVMNDETAIYNKFANSLSANMARDKVTMIKQACNAVFCNLRDPAPQAINQDPLCFSNVGTFDPSTGEIINNDELPMPEAPRPTSQKKFMYGTFKTAIYIVLIPIFAYIIYIFLTDALLPYVILPLYYWILERLGFAPLGYGETVGQLRASGKKLQKLEKQCIRDEIQFNIENDKLLKLGKPQKIRPKEFESCLKKNDHKETHESLLKEVENMINKITVPSAPSSGPSVSTGPSPAAAAKPAAPAPSSAPAGMPKFP